MDEEMVTSVIHYLEPMQVYVKMIRTYFRREEMDDFDKGYLDFFTDFEDLIYKHLQDPNSALMTLMKHYQELIVDYNESLLFRCLEALDRGYEKRHIYNEGKRDVYLRYLLEKYQYDGKELFENMSLEEFDTFEKSVFKDLDIEQLKKSSNYR